MEGGGVKVRHKSPLPWQFHHLLVYFIVLKCENMCSIRTWAALKKAQRGLEKNITREKSTKSAKQHSEWKDVQYAAAEAGGKPKRLSPIFKDGRANTLRVSNESKFRIRRTWNWRLCGTLFVLQHFLATWNVDAPRRLRRANWNLLIVGCRKDLTQFPNKESNRLEPSIFKCLQVNKLQPGEVIWLARSTVNFAKSNTDEAFPDIP